MSFRTIKAELNRTSIRAYRYTDLLHSISLTKCGRWWFLIDRVKVNGDAIGNGNLVSSGVPTSNRSTALINTMRNSNTGQLLS